MNAAPSRNDPCPCGSGARYKHCHGAPVDSETYFHLGNRLREQGDVEAAIVQYQHALALERNPAALNNLGLAHEALAQSQSAERCYREALALNPDYDDALGNLASVLFEQENYRETVARYDRLFAIRNDIPAAVWVRRAIAQQKTGAFDAAEASFREAAKREPDDPRIHANLGTLLTEQKRFEEAESSFARAVELEPSHGYAWSMLALSKLQRCAWKEIDAVFARINALLETGARTLSSNVNPFALLPTDVSAAAQLKAAKRWAAAIAPREPVARPSSTRDAHSRLRVGFVSSDWREHAVARMLVGLLDAIDRERIESFGYALLPRDDSSIGQRVAQGVEHFADVSEERTQEIARRIRSDDIDVLFDLNGYTTHDRAALFALRPAPIQINWLGYPGTTGADWFDYVLTDRFAARLSEQQDFSERFLYLPDCLLPSDARRELAIAPSRVQCGLPAGAFVFCCFNNQYKILPQVFAVWMRLLTRVAGSVLWLSPTSDEAVQNLRGDAAERGVDPERLLFAPRVASHAQYLARLQHADLFLDTTPYNAHATANDALWMNVPVVTCAGETMVSRIAGSQLHALGVEELVAYGLAQYEALALKLATNTSELARVKARLTANRGTHTLFDMQRFARAFVEAMSLATRAPLAR